MWLARPFLLSPAKGARTSIHVATAPELAGESGRYDARCKERTPSAAARDDAAARRRLWEESARLCGLESEAPARSVRACGSRFARKPRMRKPKSAPKHPDCARAPHARTTPPAAAARDAPEAERARAPADDECGFDCVLEASMDSFPASDPPGWIGARV